MDFQPDDLAAVRAVLTGQTTPAHVATNCTTVQKVLLAHAALIAGRYKQPAWKGQYGELLVELALAAAQPESGWPQSEHGGQITPDWYWDEQWRLIPTSRRLGLHQADRAGNYLEVIPAPQIVRLLREPGCRRAAQALYQKAANIVNARRLADQDYRKRTRELLAAAKANPYIDYYLQTVTTPRELLDIYHALGKLLETYTPEWLNR